MENPIESILFSEREQKYYSIEFDSLTTSQSVPIQERILSLAQISKFLKQLKINEENIKNIWELVSENRNNLRFSQFMAAMRLCSVLKQGKVITSDTFRSEQQILARKRPNPSQKPEKIEEEKKSEERVKQIPLIIEEKPKENDFFTQDKKDFTRISLQVSQEIGINKNQKFEDVNLDSDDEKKPNGNVNRFGPLGQVCEINEKDQDNKKGFEEVTDLDDGGKVGMDKGGFGTDSSELERRPWEEAGKLGDGSAENKVEDVETRCKRGIEFGSDEYGRKVEGKVVDDGGFGKRDEVFLNPQIESTTSNHRSPSPPSNPEPTYPPSTFQSTPPAPFQVPPTSSIEALDQSEVQSEINLNPKPSPHPIPLSQKPVEDPHPQEKYLNFRAKHSSPTRLEAKVEELKNSPKLVPRVPSLPKIYKGQLKKIPEEVTPPKSSSSRETIISVDSPVLITSGWWGSSSYYIYTITTRVSGKIFTVKRRFSDMDWMHNQLLTKYKGFIIPSRPEKKVLGNNEEKFVEERRLSMEKYLNIIAKHPILCNSFAFKTFTQTPNEKFDREKLNAEGVEEYSEYKNIEDAMDQVCALFQNKLQLILSQKILPFSDEISSIEEKIVKLEAPVQTFTGSLYHWVKSKTDSEKILVSFSISKDFSEKMQLFKSITRENSTNLKRLALEAKEEQLRLEGLKEALNAYKVTVEDCSKMQNLISRKLAKHKSSSNEDTKARYLSEIQSTQDVIDKYNKDLEEIEKNLVKVSKSFETSKSEHLELIVKEILETQKTHYEKESSFWTDCLYHLSN